MASAPTQTLILSHLPVTLNTHRKKQTPARSAGLRKFLLSCWEPNEFKLGQCYWNIHAGMGILDNETWQGYREASRGAEPVVGLPGISCSWAFPFAISSALSTVSIQWNSAHRSRSESALHLFS